MATAISNKDLVERCKRFILSDPGQQHLDELIRDAIITSCREICEIDSGNPLAWNRETYDEIFTKYYAEISDITQANPGVITAESVDPTLTSAHGFDTDDIVYVTGINGDDASDFQLNERLFRVTDISDSTLSLKALDGQRGISTLSYPAYDSGGTLYHAGIVLPLSSIQPDTEDVSYRWTVHDVFGVDFNTHPADPITLEVAKKQGLYTPGGEPDMFLCEKRSYVQFNADSQEFLLFWFPFAGQRYNVNLHMEKRYPDPAVWDERTYPPHPAAIHDFIWHRALANLATQSEKAQRRSERVIDGQAHPFYNTKIEIVNAAYWLTKKVEDEIKILNHSRNLLGMRSYVGRGFNA